MTKPARGFDTITKIISMGANLKSCSLLLVFLLAACSSSKKAAVNPPAQLYEVLKDNDGSKVLEGILTKEQITQDTAFHWYADNVKLVKPDAAAVSAVAAKGSKIHIVIFGGTWCDDTHQLLPKYLSLLQAANFPDDHLTLIAVDHKKQTLGGLNNVFHITNVPTCIVLKDGKEVGRIVEYGKNGYVDKELGALVNAVE